MDESHAIPYERVAGGGRIVQPTKILWDLEAAGGWVRCLEPGGPPSLRSLVDVVELDEERSCGFLSPAADQLAVWPHVWAPARFHKSPRGGWAVLAPVEYLVDGFRAKEPVAVWLARDTYESGPSVSRLLTGVSHGFRVPGLGDRVVMAGGTFGQPVECEWAAARELAWGYYDQNKGGRPYRVRTSANLSGSELAGDAVRFLRGRGGYIEGPYDTLHWREFGNGRVPVMRRGSRGRYVEQLRTIVPGSVVRAPSEERGVAWARAQVVPPDQEPDWVPPEARRPEPTRVRLGSLSVPSTPVPADRDRGTRKRVPPVERTPPRTVGFPARDPAWLSTAESRAEDEFRASLSPEELAEYLEDNSDAQLGRPFVVTGSDPSTRGKRYARPREVDPRYPMKPRWFPRLPTREPGDPEMAGDSELEPLAKARADRARRKARGKPLGIPDDELLIPEGERAWAETEYGDETPEEFEEFLSGFTLEQRAEYLAAMEEGES